MRGKFNGVHIKEYDASLVSGYIFLHLDWKKRKYLQCTFQEFNIAMETMKHIVRPLTVYKNDDHPKLFNYQNVFPG